MRALDPTQPPWSDFVALGRAAHPTLDVDAAAFVAFVAGLLEPASPVEEQLVRRHGSDLYLAWAAGSGDRDALLAIMQMVRPDLERAAARARSASMVADELGQRLWARLFVAAPGERPRIHGYHGGSPLRAWVKVIAARLLVDEQRHRGARPDHAEIATSIAAIAPTDPELQLLDERHREQIHDAVRRAMAELEDRDRALLRHRLVEGLATEAIGVVFGVHRTTVARWIDAALDRLRTRTAEIVREGTGLSGRELTSIVTLMHSRLELSIGGLLRPP